MDPKTTPWQKRFGLTTCAASELNTAIPATAVGVAAIYSKADDGEKTYLVLESRGSSLRDLCVKRLETAKIPAGTELIVSFKTLPLADKSPEAISAVCREQVIIGSEMRRELRPAMR